MPHAATDVDRLANRLDSRPEQRKDPLDLMDFLGGEPLRVRDRQRLHAFMPGQRCQLTQAEHERMQRRRRLTWKRPIVQQPFALFVE